MAAFINVYEQARGFAFRWSFQWINFDRIFVSAPEDRVGHCAALENKPSHSEVRNRFSTQVDRLLDCLACIKRRSFALKITSSYKTYLFLHRYLLFLFCNDDFVEIVAFNFSRRLD